jgi:NTE family protein
MQLPKFVQKLTMRFDRSTRKLLVRNLVFKGGGVRGIAYIGALEVLDEMGIVDHVERAAGTSAGAIAATLFSFRLTIQETKELFNTLDITRVPQETQRTLVEGDSARDRIRRLIQAPDLECANRFINNYGWYSSQYFYEWMQGIIAQQCEGNGMATFAEFEERGFRDLYIVAANVSRQRPEYFSVHNTPNVAVADAVRMSISIPMFFEALQFDGQQFGQGDYYVDGGIYDNFPMDIFDQPGLAEATWAYRDGINWETLGLFLYPQDSKEDTNPIMPKNVWRFSSLMIQSLQRAHSISSYQTNPVDKQRTIEISDCGIPTTEFNIQHGGEKYQALNESGRSAALDFFAKIE